MTFYKEWLLGVCLHYTFSHSGYCQGVLCFVLTILNIRAADLGKPSLVVENYRKPIVFTEWWKSHEQYFLHVSWKPFPESSAHQFLSSLLSTFNNSFYSTAISWYIYYTGKTEADKAAVLNTTPAHLERRYFKTRYFRARLISWSASFANGRYAPKKG